MMTPQEVASHAFSKATLGGYNMAMVDEFLDLLTEDYTALYNDNAILKNKLKVLSDTVEEYRATDNAMRKTLLAAQQMAEAMVSDAEKKKDELVHDAEAAAQARLDELQKQIADQEYRLQAAKKSTADYVRQLRQAHQGAVSYLDELDRLTAEGTGASAAVSAAPAAEHAAPVAETKVENTQVFQAVTEPAPVAVGAQTAQEGEDDPDATKRFEDLQFGRDYEIT
jgi:cell division initiation protein